MSASNTPAKPEPNTVAKKRNAQGGGTLVAYGEPMVWLTGGGLAVAAMMIVALLFLVFYQGAFTFWPRPIVRVTLHDGAIHMGEVTRDNYYQPAEHIIARLPEENRHTAFKEIESNDGWAHRRLVRTGNFELSGEHFNWVSDFEINREDRPDWAMVLERLTWGRFYGLPEAFHILHPVEQSTIQNAERLTARLSPDPTRQIRYLIADRLVAPQDITENDNIAAVVEVWTEPEAIWRQFQDHHNDIRYRWQQRRRLEKHDTGAVSHRQEQSRLNLRKAELEAERAERRYGANAPQVRTAQERLLKRQQEFDAIDAWAKAEFLRIRAEITRLNEENARYRLLLKTANGRDKTIELADVVRAYPANRLGSGQRLNIYLSRWWEFLTDDPREANMEGGVFPAIFGTVIMTLIMSIAVVPFGVLAALYLREYAKAGPMISAVRIAINNLAGVPSIVFGVFGLGFFCYLIGSGIDQLFFEAKLPSPTFGTGGIMWASLTLALLTLPVVIVATEEALAAVPGSMREGSYACGAGKWQTIKRIVLPRAMPGIMTGMILAMARGAGEVAPLMLVGAVKLAPELPFDGVFPFLHPERSFMHLGFHIYDLGFQSQNSEAAKPMVFTTTLLLIAIIAALNLAAVLIRTRLRKRFVTGTF